MTRILQATLMIGISSFPVGCDSQGQSSNKANLEITKSSPVIENPITPELKVRTLEKTPTQPQPLESEVIPTPKSPESLIKKFDPKNPSNLLPPPPKGQTVEERANIAFGKEGQDKLREGISRAKFNIKVENEITRRIQPYLKQVADKNKDKVTIQEQMNDMADGQITEVDELAKKSYDLEYNKLKEKVIEELEKKYSVDEGKGQETNVN